MAAPLVKHRYFKYLALGKVAILKMFWRKTVSSTRAFLSFMMSLLGVITCLKLMTTFSFGIVTWRTRLSMHKVIFGHNPQQLKFDIDASKEFIDGLNIDAQDKGKYILESVMQTYYDVEL